MEAQEEQRLARGQREYLDLEIRKFRRKKLLIFHSLEQELLREVSILFFLFHSNYCNNIDICNVNYLCLIHSQSTHISKCEYHSNVQRILLSFIAINIFLLFFFNNAHYYLCDISAFCSFREASSVIVRAVYFGSKLS